LTTASAYKRAARHAAAWIQGAAGFVAGAPQGVHVSYGHVRLPRQSELAVGGIVKLQSLSQEFPNSPLRFNILYLVSSRLPHEAVTLAKWARRKGARLVLNQNGVAYPAWHGPGWQRTNQPMRELLAMADHVFYQSAFCKLSADRFAGSAARTSEVLHNAVDTTRFTPAAQRPSTPTLLLGGSQDQRYRFESAINALSILNRRGLGLKLIVTGRCRWTPDEVACRAEAESMVGALGVQGDVTFTGPYTQLQAPEIFRSADLLLHTKYNDPCPAVVIEAMACGLPVVYSHSGGVPELVGDAGVGIPADLSFERDLPPDPEQLAAAVERVLNDHRSFAARARSRAVEHLDIGRWLDRHRAVFTAA
jgi:glycosyltransferase involved in cell wall biosynthesis